MILIFFASLSLLPNSLPLDLPIQYFHTPVLVLF